MKSAKKREVHKEHQEGLKRQQEPRLIVVPKTRIQARENHSERKQKLGNKSYLDQTPDQVKAISFHCYVTETPHEVSYQDKIGNNLS